METPLSEAVRQFRRYGSSRIDLAKLSAGNALFAVAMVGVMILVMGGGGLMAVAYLAQGLSQALGGRLGSPWMGSAAAGSVLLLVFWGFLRFLLYKWKTQSAKRRREAQQAHADFLTALKSAEPLAWAREHPWASTGAAAAAGFIVTGVLPGPFPEKKQPLERSPDVPAKGEGQGDDHFFWSALINVATPLLQASLAPLLTQYFKESKLGEILRANLQGRGQDVPQEGPHHQADGTENDQISEDIQKH